MYMRREVEIKQKKECDNKHGAQGGIKMDQGKGN